MQSKENAWDQMLLATGAEEVSSVKDNLGPRHGSAIIVAALRFGAMVGNAFPFIYIWGRLIDQDLKYEQELTWPSSILLIYSSLHCFGFGSSMHCDNQDAQIYCHTL